MAGRQSETSSHSSISCQSFYSKRPFQVEKCQLISKKSYKSHIFQVLHLYREEIMIIYLSTILDVMHHWRSYAPLWQHTAKETKGVFGQFLYFLCTPLGIETQGHFLWSCDNQHMGGKYLMDQCVTRYPDATTKGGTSECSSSSSSSWTSPLWMPSTSTNGLVWNRWISCPLRHL